MNKFLMKVKVHSEIDIITNSSSESFIVVKNKTEEQIEELLDKVQEDFGCTAVEFSINEAYDDDYENVLENTFEISYDFECNHEPCKLMKEKIRELLGDGNYESI